MATEAKSKSYKTWAALRLHKTQVRLGLALLIFAGTALVAGQSLAGWEKSTIEFVYGLPLWLSPIFVVITQLGGIPMLFGLGVTAYLMKHYSLVIRLLMSGLLAYLGAGIAKEIIGRGRPAEFLIDIVYRDGLVSGAGFPSGHTALATAVGITLVYYDPKRFRIIAPIAVAAVAFSRLYLGVHAPLDLVGGFAVGWACVEIFRLVRLTDLRRKKT